MEKIIGIGDSLMASGEVREAHLRTGKKIALGDGKKAFHDPIVFAHSPRIAKEGEECLWLPNHPGSRPYIAGQKDNRILFNDAFKPLRGEVFFTKEEVEWRDKKIPHNPYIVIEPKVKEKYKHGINKSWPFWDIVARAPLPFIELGEVGSGMFPHIKTTDFRQAMLILSKATLFVGTDGGLHHAAAALYVPAVVIWTGFTSPKHLGYDGHRNIHNGGEPCGYYGGICDHCRKIAHSIKPETVLEAIHEEYTRHLPA